VVDHEYCKQANEHSDEYINEHFEWGTTRIFYTAANATHATDFEVNHTGRKHGVLSNAPAYEQRQCRGFKCMESSSINCLKSTVAAASTSANKHLQFLLPPSSAFQSLAQSLSNDKSFNCAAPFGECSKRLATASVRRSCKQNWKRVWRDSAPAGAVE
jgi:hypothetical protein